MNSKELNKNHQEIAWAITFAITDKCIDYVEGMSIDYAQESDNLEPILNRMIEGVFDAVTSHHLPNKRKKE